MTNANLQPVIIAVMPRWTSTCEVANDILSSSRDKCFAVAIAVSDEQADLFRSQWGTPDRIPLLLLRTTNEHSVELASECVLEIAKIQESRPLGILLADGPEVEGFREEHRADWNRSFAEELTENLLDVQVFEYASSWRTNPPRVR